MSIVPFPSLAGRAHILPEKKNFEYLDPTDAAYLAARGVAPTVAAAADYRSFDSASDLRKHLDDAHLGVRFPRAVTARARAGGLLIPWTHYDGGVAAPQIRLRDPRTVDGRTLKFETPPAETCQKVGLTPGVDVPRYWVTDAMIADPAVPLLITEGAVKGAAVVAAAIREDSAVIPAAVMGVWNAVHTARTSGGVVTGRTLHPDLSALATGRGVFIAYDHDTLTKSQVRDALEVLTSLLEGAGARTVRVIIPPAVDGDTGAGIDDALAAGHTLTDMAADAVPLSDLPPVAEAGQGDWTTVLDRDDAGRVIKSPANVARIVGGDPALAGIRKNLFDGSMEGPETPPWPTEGRTWSEAQAAGLRLYLAEKFDIFHRDWTRDAVTVVAGENGFHPVIDYLEGLPAWDGTERLDTLLVDTLGAEDTPYVRAVTRKTLVAAVARVMRPGIKFDTALILCGGQGIGKSTLVQRLAGPWFTDGLTLTDMRDKTSAEKLRGHWLIEIAELAGMRKAELEAVKAFLSRTSDDYRPAYGTIVEHHLRQCVFIGTTNAPDGFLQDATGNRRFWPVPCRGGGATPPWTLTEDHITQIWAEALALRRADEPLYLTGEIAEEARIQQQQALEADERVGLVQEYLDRLLPEDWDARGVDSRRSWLDTDREGTVVRQQVAPVEIFVECFGKNRGDLRRRESTEIAQILAKIPGWERSDERPYIAQYGRCRVWVRRDSDGTDHGTDGTEAENGASSEYDTAHSVARITSGESGENAEKTTLSHACPTLVPQSVPCLTWENTRMGQTGQENHQKWTEKKIEQGNSDVRHTSLALSFLGEMNGENSVPSVPSLEALREWARSKDRLGWDVEATGTDPHAPGFALTHLSVGAADGSAWVVDARDTALARQVAEALAEHPKIAAHNAQFDVSAAQVCLDVWLGHSTDSLVLARNRWPGRPSHSLKALRPATADVLEALRGRWAAHTGTTPRGKAWLADAVTQLPWDDPALLAYSAADAIEAARLVAEIADGLTDAEMDNCDRDVLLERAWWPRTHRGYRVDTTVLDEIETAQAQVRTTAIERYSVDLGTTAAAVREWVTGLGVTGLPTTAAGVISLSAKTLADAEVPAPAADAWADFLAVREAMSTANVITSLRRAMDVQGRVHPHLAINGAPATGRMASTGPNLQNLPDQVKRAFMTEPGHVFVGLDLDRIEPCVLAAVSGDPALLEATKSGDVYLNLAQTIWPDRALTADSAERKTAKTALLASIYGQGARSLGANLGITAAEARQVLRDLERAYPAMAAWKRDLQARAEAGETLFSPIGRRLPDVSDAPYRAVNYVIQGTAAAIFKVGTQRVMETLGEQAPYLPIHDEIIIEVPADQAEHAREALETAMTGEIFGVTVRGTAHVLGDRLAHA